MTDYGTARQMEEKLDAIRQAVMVVNRRHETYGKTVDSKRDMEDALRIIGEVLNNKDM